jgi:hypothetical protein
MPMSRFLPLGYWAERWCLTPSWPAACALGAITGLTVHLPLYYEVVYHLTASEAGLALIPLAAISTCGAAIAGRTMAPRQTLQARRHRRNVRGDDFGAVLTVTTLPLWGCWSCCRCSRSGSAPHSGQRGLAAKFRGRARRSAP